MKHQFQAYHAEDTMLAQQRIVDPTSSCSQCYADGSNSSSTNTSSLTNLASISNNKNNNNLSNNPSSNNNNNNSANVDPSLLIFNESSLNSSYEYNMDTDKIGGKYKLIFFS